MPFCNISSDLEGVINARELAIILSRVRGRNVPDRTLRFWRNELCVRPIHGRFYTYESLQVLIRLVRWLERGGTIQGFVSILIDERKRQTETTTTIDV